MARKSSSSGNDANLPEQLMSDAPTTGTALIEGNTFKAKAVTYVVVDGLAMFEGDIILGTEAEVAERTTRLKAELSGQLSSAVLISGNAFRWPNCTVPYTIASNLTNQSRVTDAIAHWEANTRFRFVVRTTEANFVTFRPGGGCSSSVGMQGGQQFINLGASCTTGNTIHEVGHAVGLWHEQSREDRDSFVTINWAKIQSGFESNFNQHIADGDDIGAYDYGSIMHYPRDAFSIDGTDTITPTTAGAVIGQRTALSAGDIAAANSMCPKPVKEITKDPISDPVVTRKEAIKDIRFETKKEIVADTRKELVKDRIKEVAYDPAKSFVERVNPLEILSQLRGRLGFDPTTGGPLPFAVATPHQAPDAAVQAQMEAAIPDLDAQLAALAEQIAQLEAARNEVQAQYDELAALLKQALDTHDAAGG
jgi:hypothetical protein